MSLGNIGKYTKSIQPENSPPSFKHNISYLLNEDGPSQDGKTQRRNVAGANRAGASGVETASAQTDNETLPRNAFPRMRTNPASQHLSSSRLRSHAPIRSDNPSQGVRELHSHGLSRMASQGSASSSAGHHAGSSSSSSRTTGHYHYPPPNLNLNQASFPSIRGINNSPLPGNERRESILPEGGAPPQRGFGIETPGVSAGSLFCPTCRTPLPDRISLKRQYVYFCSVYDSLLSIARAIKL